MTKILYVKDVEAHFRVLEPACYYEFSGQAILKIFLHTGYRNCYFLELGPVRILDKSDLFNYLNYY